jgi:hypothetical protein
MTPSPAEPAFPTGTPHTRSELDNALGALLAEGHARFASPPAAWFFAPQGTAWAPAGHIRHLSRASWPLVKALNLPRLVLGLRFGRHRGTPEGFERIRSRYLALLDAGATAGRFAPSPEPPPTDPEARRAEILAEWSRATVDLVNASGRWPDAALDRYQLPHPLLGMLTVRDMLAFTVYHTAHHLRRIMERDAHA